ncbi:hypothetical protein TNCV_2543741 [Trichonephila clavipes]|nr:hypothetical protein TNCV_2543741 [Trichonephila clavipes]
MLSLELNAVLTKEQFFLLRWEKEEWFVPADSLVADIFPWPPSDQHSAITGTKAEPAFNKKTQNVSIPSSNELWLDTTGVANGNGLESVECTLQGASLRAVLEVIDF